MSQTVDFQGNITTYRYDNTATGQGRLVSKTVYANAEDQTNGITAKIVAYTYDAFGRMVKEVDSSHGTSRYTFDDRGNLIREETPEGVITREYDNLNRQVAVSTADMRKEQTYDALGRLATITMRKRNGAQLAAPETTGYAYDKNGNLDEIHQANGVVSDYIFDTLNRLTRLTQYKPEDGTGNVDDFRDNGVLANFVYTLNLDGSRAGVVETKADGSQDQINWVYDANGKLTQEVYDSSNNALDYTDTFVYDLVGNRTDYTRTGSQDNFTKTYSYDLNDRLLAETADHADNAKDTQAAYAWSSTVQVGKVVHSGLTDQGAIIEQTVMEYGPNGRLAKQTTTKDGGSVVKEFAYDESGLRTAEKTTQNGQASETHYLFDKRNPTGYAQVVEERTDGTLTKTYTIGLDVLAQAAANAVLTLIYDGHGSTRQLTDANGNLVAIAKDNNGNEVPWAAFTAYGEAVGFDFATAVTNLLYSGEWTGNDGKQYLRRREYDPSTGRMTSLDPYAGDMGVPLSLHKYLYAHGNPVMGVDPSGMMIAGLLDSLAAFTIGLAMDAWYAVPQMAALAWAFTKISLLVFVASSLWLGLEQTGMVPRTGYTEGVVAWSGAAAFFGFTVWQILEGIPPAPRNTGVGPQPAQPQPGAGPGPNTKVIRLPETKEPNPVKPQDAVPRWDRFLGKGPYTNVQPRTGQPDQDRIVSADGTRSIRYGRHEMESPSNMHHYHEETWSYDRVTDTMTITNTLVRVPIR